jgi:hypothetical protein
MELRILFLPITERTRYIQSTGPSIMYNHHSIRQSNPFFSFSFLAVLRFDSQNLVFARQVLYHLNHTPSLAPIFLCPSISKETLKLTLEIKYPLSIWKGKKQSLWCLIIQHNTALLSHDFMFLFSRLKCNFFHFLIFLILKCIYN